MPATLKADASRSRATRASGDRLPSIAAVRRTRCSCRSGPGYPIPPTTTFSAAVSVVNRGSAPTEVIAIIRVTPTGTSGTSTPGGRGAVAAGGAVALQLPTMAMLPGAHYLVSIELVRIRRASPDGGGSWVRTVVVGQDPSQ